LHNVILNIKNAAIPTNKQVGPANTENMMADLYFCRFIFYSEYSLLRFTEK